MDRIKKRITFVKEEHGFVWFHVEGRWIAIDAHLFDKYFRQRFIKRLYSKENRRLERQIYRLEKEARRLRKQGKEQEAISREYHASHLRGRIKKELHLHDLVRKRVYFDIY